MMRFQAGRLAGVLAPLLLVAACASEPSSPQTLNDRMQARLAPEITGGQVAVQPLAGGTQVAIPQDSLFSVGSTQLSDKGRLIMTYVVQALLEPTILTIAVTDPAATPDTLQAARAQTVVQFFRDHAQGAQLLATDAPQVVTVGAVGTPLQGLAITVNVVSG